MKHKLFRIILIVLALLVSFFAFLFVKSSYYEREETMAFSQEVDVAVRDYVRTNKRWRDDVYKIDPNVTKDSAGNLLVTVIHQDDIKHPTPGGGKSFQLRIDANRISVIDELAFQ